MKRFIYILLLLLPFAAIARDYKAGEYIYLKNHVPEGWLAGHWILPQTAVEVPCAWVRLYDAKHKVQKDILMELYEGKPGAEGSIYSAQVDKDYNNIDHLVFTRNSKIGDSPTDGLWNFTNYLKVDGTDYNLFTRFIDCDGQAYGRFEAETVIINPQNCSIEILTTALGGIGTKDNPLQYTVGDTIAILLKSSQEEVTQGFAWSLNGRDTPEEYTDEGAWSTVRFVSTTKQTLEPWYGAVWATKGGTLSEKYVLSDTLYTITVPACVDSLVYAKWTDVLFVDASGSNFTAYQWFRGPDAIQGETSQILRQSSYGREKYHVKLYTASGDSIITCPRSRTEFPRSAEQNITGLSISPNPASAGSSITLTTDTQGTFGVYTQAGVLVSSISVKPGSTLFTITTAGQYLGILRDSSGDVVSKCKIVVR